MPTITAPDSPAALAFPGTPAALAFDVRLSRTGVLHFRWNDYSGELREDHDGPVLRVGCTTLRLDEWLADYQLDRVPYLLGFLGDACPVQECFACCEALDDAVAAYTLLLFVREHWRGLLAGTATLD